MLRLIFLVSLSLASGAMADCSPGFKFLESTGKCYRLQNETNWDEAQDACDASTGESMVTGDDSDEIADAFGLFESIVGEFHTRNVWTDARVEQMTPTHKTSRSQIYVSQGSLSPLVEEGPCACYDKASRWFRTRACGHPLNVLCRKDQEGGLAPNVGGNLEVDEEVSDRSYCQSDSEYYAVIDSGYGDAGAIAHQFFPDEVRNFTSGQEFCRDLGGDLAALDDEVDNIAYTNVMGNPQDITIWVSIRTFGSGPSARESWIFDGHGSLKVDHWDEPRAGFTRSFTWMFESYYTYSLSPGQEVLAPTADISVEYPTLCTFVCAYPEG